MQTLVVHLVPSILRIIVTVMVILLHKPRSSAAFLSSPRFIPDIVCIPSIHLFLTQPSSFSTCQHHFLFKTVCPHHVAKKQHLLFCCPLSLRQISSCLSYLHQYRFICSFLSPRDPQHPSPDPHLAGINFLFQYPCLVARTVELSVSCS